MSEGVVTAGSTGEHTDWTSALELMQASGATEPIRQVRAPVWLRSRMLQPVERTAQPVDRTAQPVA